MSNLKSIFDNVVRFLKSKEAYRDDDRLLAARYWYDEISDKLHKPTEAASAMDVLRLYKDGKLTNHDTITRARRKAQEEIPALRGKTYSERQLEKTSEVKAVLREIAADLNTPDPTLFNY